MNEPEMDKDESWTDITSMFIDGAHRTVQSSPFCTHSWISMAIGMQLYMKTYLSRLIHRSTLEG